MDRELRRETSKRKWLARARKVYYACGYWMVPRAGIHASTPWFTDRTHRMCESITDFLNNSKYAKVLKKCTVPYRSKATQFEYKKENRKKRHESKREILEGIQEYNDRYYEDFE